MRKQLLIGLITLSFMLGITRAVPATSYTWTSFDYPGALFTYAHGVNNSGQIVGGYSDGSTDYGFSLNGGIFTSFNYPGAYYTRANGVSNNGQIVGGYGDGSGNHGFSRDSGGVFSSIDYPGSYYTWAHGVNNSGQIVGGYYNGSVYRGFLATPVAPEPAAWMLFASGLPVLPVVMRRRLKFWKK